MKLAIMQPYLFPYIGYFQLINAVDLFVLYDDVTYIKQGWINRNKILLDNKAYLMTLEVSNASSFRPINEVKVGRNCSKLLKTIAQSYRQAPCFIQVMPLVELILENKEENLSRFIEFSLRQICIYLNISTKIVVSSCLSKNNDLKAEKKVINICQSVLARTDHPSEPNFYINAFGGRELYSKDHFADNGLNLKFIKSRDIHYQQFKKEFIPWLSIIDLLMFNSQKKMTEIIMQYDLI
jgi:hypothetical protein